MHIPARPVIATIFTATALVFAGLTSASAAEQFEDTGQALEIAPPVLNLTADPGEVIEAQINLRDVSPTALVVTGQVNDFEAQGEDGTPRILLDEGEPNPYSIQPWVDPLPELTLEPQQIESFPVTIRVPADAAPGGYFGVIRFTATAPDLDDTGVSLSASLGALVLLRVNGDANEQLEIAEFSVNDGGEAGTLFESTPLTFVTRLENKGNVHEQPRGQVEIKDMFGKTVAAVNVNLPPRNILPQSIRRFESSLDKTVIGDTRLFGQYTANLTVTYGQDGETVQSSLKFWVIPYKLIGAIILSLIVLFFVLRTMLRRYNQRIIKKAQQRRR